MKTKWFVGILSVLIVLPINAQLKTGLYVDSYSDSAQLKVRGTKNWTKPAHKQSIMRLDSVRVPEKSKMTIVDAVSGNIYPCDVSFFGSVSQFIQQAKKSQSKLLVELVKQLGANALGKNRQTAHNVYGGATRTEEDDHYYDSIACLVLTTARSKQAHYTNLKLRAIRQNGMIHFAVENADSKDYYVNILSLNMITNEVALKLVLEPDVAPETLLLPAGKTLDLDMFCFIDQPDIQYILFATESPFASSTLQSLLRYPEDINCNF